MNANLKIIPTRVAVLDHYREQLKLARADAIFRCWSCGYVGPSDETYDFEVREGMNDRPATQVPVEIHRCFECRSDDLHEAQWCSTCSIRPAAVEGDELCGICRDEETRQENEHFAKVREQANADFRATITDMFTGGKL